jgi:CheY-like chemotaxis protein
MTQLLIIDGDAGIRQVISRVLEPHGYTLTAADDGAQGVAAFAAENSIDAVLADTALSDMETKELLTRLQAAKPGIPVVIMAGFADLDLAAELVRLGAAGYITKPFKVQDLILTMQKVLSKKPSAPPAPRPAAAPGDEGSPAAGQPEESVPLQRIARSPRKLLIRRLVLPVVAVILCMLAAAGAWLQRAPKSQSFTLPYANPSGMCWDGKNLWISDWVEGSVYEHALAAGCAVTATVTTPNIEPAGLAVEGQKLWIAHTLGNKIYAGTPRTPFVAQQSFPSPGAAPSGLFHDGTYLWSLDFQAAKIYRHSPTATDLTVLAVYDSPAVNPCSMFRYQNDYGIADAATNRIYQVSTANFAITAVYTVPLPSGVTGRFSAVACDGKNLWVTCDGMPQLFRVPVTALHRVKS